MKTLISFLLLASLAQAGELCVRPPRSVVRYREVCRDSEQPWLPSPAWYDQAGKVAGAYGAGDLVYRASNGRFYFLEVSRTTGHFARAANPTWLLVLYQTPDCTGQPYLPPQDAVVARGFFTPETGSAFWRPSDTPAVPTPTVSVWDGIFGVCDMQPLAIPVAPAVLEETNLQEPLAVR